MSKLLLSKNIMLLKKVQSRENTIRLKLIVKIFLESLCRTKRIKIYQRLFIEIQLKEINLLLIAKGKIWPNKCNNLCE